MNNEQLNSKNYVFVFYEVCIKVNTCIVYVICKVCNVNVLHVHTYYNMYIHVHTYIHRSDEQSH